MIDRSKDADKNKLADRIAGSVEYAPFQKGKFDLKKHPLPFYKNAYNVSVKCFSTRPIITKKYVCDDIRVFETDGESETIEAINEAFSLNLNLQNVSFYVAFYFQNVLIDGSFLRLVFKAKDIIGDDFEPSLKKELKKTVNEPVLCQTAEGFMVSGFVLSNDTLFRAEIFVTKKGGISIKRKETIAKNLPIFHTTLR